MFLGLMKLHSVAKDLNDFVINKKAILLLAILSVFLVIATFGMCYFGSRAKDDSEAFNIMQTVQTVILLASEVIMTAIINTIVTKILVLKEEDSDESVARLPEEIDINMSSIIHTGDAKDSVEPIHIDPVGTCGGPFYEVRKIDEGIIKFLFVSPNKSI